MPFLFFCHFPIDQSLAFFVKFDSESYHLSPVSLERLHIATIDNLANGSFLATIVSQFQFYHIDIARSSCYNIYPARGKHVLYFNLQTDGIENRTDDQTLALLHIHGSHLLVAIRHIGNQCLQ